MIKITYDPESLNYDIQSETDLLKISYKDDALVLVFDYAKYGNKTTVLGISPECVFMIKAVDTLFFALNVNQWVHAIDLETPFTCINECICETLKEIAKDFKLELSFNGAVPSVNLTTTRSA